MFFFFEFYPKFQLAIRQKLLSHTRDVILVTPGRDVRFGPNLCQIGSKWDKSGTFSDQISEQYEQVPDLSHLGAILTHFGAKSELPA